MSGQQHRMVPVGWRGLHPHEARIIAVASRKGVWVRVCVCGDLVFGNNEVDLFCNFKEHRARKEAAR